MLMFLSIVVPCYNEEAVVEIFDRRTREVLDGLGVNYELCYVDDGSGDATLEKLRGLAASNPQSTQYVSFSRNFGKEAAMLAGLQEAGGDAVILMDADLQHPPELIGQMIELYERGNDQVIARRSRAGDKPLRTLLSKLYYRLVNSMMDVDIIDGAGDFRLLSRRAVDALLSLPEHYRFSKGLFAWIGFEAVTFEYDNVARAAGATKWRFGALFEYGIDGLLSFNNRPLRLGIYFGLTLSGLALLYAIWIVIAALVTSVQTPGYVTLLVAVVGIGGLQVSMLGLMGEYVGRIYVESKRRPNFLVKEASVTLSQDRPAGDDIRRLIPRARVSSSATSHD
jgi:polyisoprenyl-phosphate glycosyltransferase